MNSSNAKPSEASSDFALRNQIVYSTLMDDEDSSDDASSPTAAIEINLIHNENTIRELILAACVIKEPTFSM